MDIKYFLFRWLNRIRIAESFRHIIDKSAIEKEIYLIPVAALGCGGSPHRYYHFLFDLLLPVYCLLMSTQSDVTFIVDDCGPFTERITEIFPERLRIRRAEEQIDAYKAKIIGTNPKHYVLNKKLLQEFKDFVVNRLQIELSENPKRILLIERMPPEKFYYSDKCVVKGGGSARRSIINHEEIRETIAAMIAPPYQFENIRLEEMSFVKQIQYFHQAHLVIGQHGAGLANSIWMREGMHAIEFGISRKKHFRRISQYKGLNYELYKTQDPYASIDAMHLSKWLTSQSKASHFFIHERL